MSLEFPPAHLQNSRQQHDGSADNTDKCSDVHILSLLLRLSFEKIVYFNGRFRQLAGLFLRCGSCLLRGLTPGTGVMIKAQIIIGVHFFIRPQ